MVYKNKILSVLSAVCALGILLVNIPQVKATATGRTVRISTAEEFLDFAKECGIDTASEELTVELAEDITLSGTDFSGVPIFCGTFNGGGHTISGLSLRGNSSEIGLFRHLQKGAEINNLNVTGTVAPAGSSDKVGGIVGVNKGKITSCTFGGSVSGNDSVGGIVGKNCEGGVVSQCTSTATLSGESAAGGIAGTNNGVITNCENSGSVNTVYKDETLSDVNPDDISLETASGVEETIGKSDVGGIAGYSTGMIQRCENKGTVGYQHIGYNIGGIVGRQYGTLSSCKNFGTIYGRKDVGGIAGQMEPYRSIEFSEDTAKRLENETDTLSDNIDKLISDTADSGDSINSEIQKLTSQMNSLQDSADTISNRAEEIANGFTNGANEIMVRVEIALDKAPAVITPLEEACVLFGDFSEKLSAVLDEMAQSGEYSADAVNTARAALDKINAELPRLSDGIAEIANALDDLRNSVTGSDEAKTALDNLKTALNSASETMKNISDAANELASSFGSVSGGENEAFKTLFEQTAQMMDILADINDNINIILDNIDANGVENALGDLSDGAGEISDAISAINADAKDFGECAKQLETALETLNGATSDASDAADIMANVADKLASSANGAKDIVNSLAEKPAVQFPAFDETFTSSADNISDNIRAMTATLSRISSSAKSDGDIILSDIQSITDSIERILDIFADAYKDLMSDEDHTYSEDISDSEVTEQDGAGIYGKALYCENSGAVNGDVNVGGITGAMAIEFDLDPEDDITLSGERSANFSYNVLDVIENCENSGQITAKKNYCGGIVGRMDMGLVKNSRASGTVESTDGNYVGGIAGSSTAKIRGCASKVTLSGLACIGGIAGEGGIITDCVSICDITNFTEKIGAVAGYVDFDKDNTEIANNFFVDRGVEGIDRVSYSGLAQPFSYDEFARRTGGFADIVLDFYADGTKLASVTVPYNGAIADADIPEIPAKDGCFARWEEFPRENITFPLVINAEYTGLLTSVASDLQTESGLALVLADGNFTDSAKLAVATESDGVTAPADSELRVITFTESNSNVLPTALRFYSNSNNAKISQYLNGEWESVDFTKNGSYLIVTDPVFDSQTAIYCITETPINLLPIIIPAVICLSALAVIIAVNVKKKAKKKVNS